jgi:SAM-dependent methyltransferase
MILRNPKNRFDLKISKRSKVLEVGGGHNPHPRSNVVVDKYTDDNTHRSGDVKILKNQKFISADGEYLPFKDSEFDYVICCHVLEHVENPAKFLTEQFRVSPQGYLEVPSLIGEYLSPKSSHKWVMHHHNNILYLVDKEKINFAPTYDLVELIQDYLPTHSIGFKILERTHPNLFTIRIEWENSFEFVINPDNPEILGFFMNKWKFEWRESFFPKKNMLQELTDSIAASWDISKNVIRSKLFRNS